MKSSFSINDNLHLTNDILKAQLSLYEALSNGVGIKGILYTAEKYFNNPIFVCDVSYNIIAASHLSKDMPYGIKYNKDKAYLDPDDVKSMKKFKLIERIYNYTDAFKCTTEDRPNNVWVFCSIRLNNIVTGYIAICYSTTSPSEDDLLLSSVLAKVISLEMQKNDFFITKTGLKYEYFLIDLLEGKYDDMEIISSRINILDHKFLKYICIITLSCDDPSDNTLFNKKQIEYLRSIYSGSMSVVYKDSIVLLISQNTPFEFNDEAHMELIDFLSRNHVKAGVSQAFTNPLDAPTYYKQSLISSKVGKLLYPDGILYYSPQLLLYHMFYNCELSELNAFIHYHIKELEAYDSNYNTEFLSTLKTYLQEKRNPTQTAKSLHIHRSTLFYRLKKIEELLSISINDSKILFLYEISIMAQDYIKALSNNPATKTIEGAKR